jgi:hypothetical protein
MIRPRPISAFLNYAASIDGGRTGLTLETGISLRGKLLRSSVARDLFGRWRRGPTAFVVDDERRLMRWEIGDGVLSGGSLGGAAQVLGVTVSREFGIDVITILSAASIAEAQLGLNCSIGTTPVAFGDYDVLSATPKTTTGTVT